MHIERKFIYKSGFDSFIINQKCGRYSLQQICMYVVDCDLELDLVPDDHHNGAYINLWIIPFIGLQ